MYQGDSYSLMADYNVWMNRKLYEAAAGLADAERKRDLGGVVYVGDAPLAGALEALERLRATGLPLRYITTTTRTPKRTTARP